MARWMGMFRALGDALLDVLKTELTELKEELGRLARQYATGVVFIAAGVGLSFLTLLAAVLGSIYLLGVWLPLWAASFVVAAALAAVALALAVAGRRRLRRLEPPTETMRRRFQDHVEWWKKRVRDEESGPEPRQGERR